MRRVFIDSAFWIALRLRKDPQNNQAQKIARWLGVNRCTLIVTPFIFAESHAYFCRSEIRHQVVSDFWANPAVVFEQPSYKDQEQALNILKEHGDKTYSFADAISFVVMMRLGLQEVVTFDRHFHQFGGFTVIDETSL
ncbi:MAG: type II toxin-antitoxin system VapC family toxin [Limisphaerales bacterium]